MSGGAGSDEFVQAVAGSVRSSGRVADVTVNTTTDALAFANGVDVISAFASGSDKLNAITGVGTITQLSEYDNTNLVDDTTYALRGTWNAATATFAFNTTGVDLLYGTADVDTTGGATQGQFNGLEADAVVMLGAVTGFTATTIV